MHDFFSSLNASVAVQVFFWILSAVLVFMVVPQFGKIPELTRKAFDWVYAKAGEAKNRLVAGLLQRLSIIVRDVVLRLENTAIEDLKVKAADGKLTKEELLECLKKVKDDAIQMAKDQATLEGISDLLVTLVFGDESKMTTWISEHIETQVATLPPSGLQTVKALPGVSDPYTVAQPAIAVGLKKQAAEAEIAALAQKPKAEAPAAPAVPPPAAA